MRIPLLALALAVSLGCAHTPSADRVARGPGAVFPSVEAAAIDALTYAHQAGRADGAQPRMRSGTIRPVAGGGYTYAGITEAPRHEPHRVAIQIAPTDVAHFRTYTRQPLDGSSAELNRRREQPSRQLERVVDEIDPLHRPGFFLTPSLVVRVYRGEERGVLEIADLRTAPADTLVARRESDAATPDR